jgi:hypothetical protein
MEKTISIKLFLLTRNESVVGDEYSSCVVAAGSEKEARELANNESNDEGYVWTDGTLVDAQELSPTSNEGVEGIVLWSREDI